MQDLSKMTTKELVAVYNTISGKAPIAKWGKKVSELQARVLKLKPDQYYIENPAPSDRMSDFEAPTSELSGQKGRPVSADESHVKPKAKSTKNKAKDAERGAIRRYCEEMLLKSKGVDEKSRRPLGLPYSEILDAVQKKFPASETSLNCLRWYATKMNKRTGKERVVMPVRPKAVAA